MTELPKPKFNFKNIKPKTASSINPNPVVNLTTTPLPHYGLTIPAWNESGEFIVSGQKVYLPHHKNFKNAQLSEFYESYKYDPQYGYDDLDKKIKERWIANNGTAIPPPSVVQEFNKFYMRPQNVVRGELMNHNLGSGKTRGGIEIAKQYIPYGITPLIILPASLTQTWKSEIMRWDAENIDKYEFISYNASNSPKKINEAIRNNTQIENLDSMDIRKGKKYFIIIDEAHNFMSSLTNTATSRSKLYSTFMNFEGKILCLTATPTINKPFELALFFNILKGYLDSDHKTTLFPENELDFKSIYSDKPKTKSFMYRINGMVSYYIGNLMSGQYPDKIIHPPELIKMIDNQLSYYQQTREEEQKLEKFAFSDEIQQSYRSGSRMASNFVFPINRPKPRNFTSDELAKYEPTLSCTLKWKDEQKRILSKILTKVQYDEFETFYRNPVIFIGDKLDVLHSLYSGLSATDVKAFRVVYNEHDIESYSIYNIKRNAGHISSYADAKALLLQIIAENPQFTTPAEGNISNVGNITKSKSVLSKYSSKYQRIFDNIVHGKGNKGLVFVYSAFKELEGLTMFSMVLENSSYKYTNLTADVANSINQIIDTPDATHFGDLPLFANRYLIYSGDIDKEQRDVFKKIFTHPRNAHGEICKVFLGTPAAAEGLDLKGVQQVHFMEQHWNYVRFQQVIGRAVRFRSHISLPKDEQQVHVYQYISVEREDESIETSINKGESTDLYLYKLSHQKNATIEKYLSLVKNSAIDCDILLEHNNALVSQSGIDVPIQCHNMALINNIIFNKNSLEDMNDSELISETTEQSTKYYKSVIEYGNIKVNVHYLLHGIENENSGLPVYHGKSPCCMLRSLNSPIVEKKPSQKVSKFEKSWADISETDSWGSITATNALDKWQHIYLYEPKSAKMIKTNKVRVTCSHNDSNPITTIYETYNKDIHLLH